MRARHGRHRTAKRRHALVLVVLGWIGFHGPVQALDLESPYAAVVAKALPRPEPRWMSPAAAPEPGGAANDRNDPLLPAVFSFRKERRKPSVLDLLGQVRGLRKGVGMDYGLPAQGKLHLNLYAGQDGFAQGRRWDLGSYEDDLARHRKWSLGASVDLVRFRRLTEEQLPDARITVSPQLLLDVDALAGLPGTTCDLLVQHGLWRGLDTRATSEDRVLQLSLRWKF